MHGGGASNLWQYKTFRGLSNQVLGCQCVYDSGNLVNNEYMGTFDFAFSLISLKKPMKYHNLWDVFPHEAYIDYFVNKGQTFSYTITTNLY